MQMVRPVNGYLVGWASPVVRCDLGFPAGGPPDENLLPYDGHGDAPLAGANVALQQEDLLPRAEHEPALFDGHGQARAEQGGLEVGMAVAVVPGPFVAILPAGRDQTVEQLR